MEFLPSEINDIIRDYSIFKPKSKEELQEAVNLWCIDKEVALTKYLHISSWNTSLITDMKNLFYGKDYFNDNISNWDVSSVTDMGGMFMHATIFNQPLNSWNVSSVTDMSIMFHGASSFNQTIDSWDLSSVTEIGGMFDET